MITTGAITEERFEQLAAEHGVTRAALANIFERLKPENVPPEKTR